MKLRNLLVAVAVLAILGGFAWWAEKHPKASDIPPSTPSPSVLDVAESKVQSFEISAKDAKPVSLDRSSGNWKIISPQALPADNSAVTTLLSSLNPLTADSVIEGKASDLSKYGLQTPAVDLALHLKDGKTQHLLLGDDIPSMSLSYARLNDNPKVFAVSTSTKSSLTKTENDLRDKRLLPFDSTKLTRIDIAAPTGAIEFGKNNANDWQILKPGPYRADSSQVDDLVSKLGDAKMDVTGDAAAEAKKAADAYAAGTKTATVQVTDASGTQLMDVHKKGDDFYAKSAAAGGIYKLSVDTGKLLAKSADDFRNKKLFDFGFSDPTKLTVQATGSDQNLTRTGTDWKRGGQTLDAGTVQSLIDKIRDMSASKFVTAGFTAPALTISVVSNDGKRSERVEFAKTSDGYVARRENDSASYQLDGKPVDEVLSAAKGIKTAAPPAKK